MWSGGISRKKKGSLSTGTFTKGQSRGVVVAAYDFS